MKGNASTHTCTTVKKVTKYKIRIFVFTNKWSEWKNVMGKGSNDMEKERGGLMCQPAQIG